MSCINDVTPYCAYFVGYSIKIWKTKDVPTNWGLAFILLLSKSDILNLPSEFRPIAIGSTGGKLFFSGVANRTHDYFVDNEYIRRETQKGFINGVPGV